MTQKSAMTDARIRVSELKDVRSHEVDLRPGPEELERLRVALGLEGLRKVSLTGRLVPEGSRNWLLSARLGASVVQPCVVTLKPVTTRIEEEVTRRYTPDMPEMPEDEEAEMPEDDTLEPLGSAIDLGAVLEESLTLALPDYPRADEAEEPVEAAAAPPGVEPLRDEDLKPFAALKELKGKLEGGA